MSSLIFKPPTQLEPGTQLGPYHVAERLGEGGMGLVVKATDQRNGVFVALKLLRQRFNPGHREALIEEARVASKLRSPHCVRLYDAFAFGPEQQPVIVYEYVQGSDLRALLDSSLIQDRKPPGLSPLAACLVLEQCLKGVRAAHSVHLVHQDLKPENFLVEDWVLDKIDSYVDEQGRVDDNVLETLLLEYRDRNWIKLADWGMSLIREDSEDLSQSLSLTFTQIPENKRGGTLVYMPPEQIDGTGISRRTDVFALGLIFYELLTGAKAQNARMNSEGIKEEDTHDLQSYMVKLMGSDAWAAVDVRRDRALRRFRGNSAVRELLNGMTARLKSNRMDSEAVEQELKRLLEERPADLFIEKSLPLKEITLACLGILVLLLGLTAMLWSKKSEKPTNTATSQTEIGPKPEDLADSKADKPSESPSSDPIVEVNKPRVEVDPDAEILARLKAKEWSRHKDILVLKAAHIEALKLSPLKTLTFPKVRQLTESAAQALRALEIEGLELNGLLALDGSAGAALKDIQCQKLSLNSLEKTDAPTIKALATSKLKSLSVGLAQWPEPLLKALAHYRGETLSLPSLKELKPEMVEALKAWRGKTLKLDGLREPDTKQLTSLLKGRELTTLSLSGLLQLNEASAQSLLVPKSLHRLQLNNVAFLSTEAAKVFSKLKCPVIELGKLTSLKHEQAKAMTPAAFINGEWILGLEHLTAPQAHAMSQWKIYRLSLPKLKSTSLKALEYINYYTGFLKLGFKDISSKELTILTKTKARTLNLSRLEFLDDDTAHILSKFPNNKLEYPKLDITRPAILKAILSRKTDRLQLPCKQLTPEILSALSAFKGQNLELLELVELTPKAGQALSQLKVKRIDFKSLTTLPKASAEGLGAFTGTLAFFKLRELSEGALRGLLKAPKQRLEFHKLKGLDSSTAKAFESARVTSLSFTDLDTFSESLAQGLSKAKVSSLTFSQLKRIDRHARKHLGSCKFTSLSFHSLSFLDEDGARALSKFKGDLFIHGLKTLSRASARGLRELRCKGLTFGADAVESGAFEYLRDFEGFLTVRQLTSCSSTDGRHIGQLRARQVKFVKLVVTDAETAEGMAAFKKDLVIERFEKWSPAACAGLAKFRGQSLKLFLYNKISPSLLHALKGLSCKTFIFNRHQALKAEEAKALGQLSVQTLNLQTITSMDDEAATGLAPFRGILDLRGLNTMNAAKAKGFSQFKGQCLWLGGLKGRADWLKELKDLRCRNIAFMKMNDLDLPGARVIQQFQCNVLEFLALTVMKEGVPKALAKYRGAIYLPMRSLDPNLRTFLKNFRGLKISLHSKSLNLEEAQFLTRIPCQWLQFYRINLISEEALAALADFPGRLDMPANLEKDFLKLKAAKSKKR